MAYLVWLRWAEAGPRVDASTWDREVAAVNRFYRWQIRAGNVQVNPVPQRERRLAPVEAGHGGARAVGQTPATYSHSAARERIAWFPAASYRPLARYRDAWLHRRRAA